MTAPTVPSDAAADQQAAAPPHTVQGDILSRLEIKRKLYLLMALIAYLLKGLTGRTARATLGVNAVCNIRDTIILIVVFSTIVCFLFVTMVCFYLGSLMGIGHLLERYSNKYRKGLSIANWANTDLFSDKAVATIASARATLSGGPTMFLGAPPAGYGGAGLSSSALHTKTTRVFNLDVAKTLLTMSSLVYEVNFAKVREARMASTSSDASKLLLESEKFIKDQASDWGLRYLSVSGFEPDSDLGSKAGPFASCFHTPPGAEEPFIVLCFKGTTPNNFAEFLVDATIARVSCGSVFGLGTAHQGFMHELYPIDRHSSDDYGQITRALRDLADELSGSSSAKEQKGKPVPLWITGHSLGAALASLIFTRYLHCPSDLGDCIVLRDGYTFGAPRTGDASFVSKFEEMAWTPFELPNVLWRVVNDYDVVTHVPLGSADNVLNRAYLPRLSVLNYGHIGVPFTLEPSQSPFYQVDTTPLYSATRVVVIKDGEQGAPSDSWFPSWFPFAFLVKWMRWWNPLSWSYAPFVLPLLLVTSIWNHFTASYYNHLCQLEIDGHGNFEGARDDTADTTIKAGADEKIADGEKGQEKEEEAREKQEQEQEQGKVKGQEEAGGCDGIAEDATVAEADPGEKSADSEKGKEEEED